MKPYRFDERNADDLAVRPFPTRLLAGTLVLTVGVLLAMGWSVFDSYRNFVAVQLHDLRLAELRGTILHLDEVLTISARMAATTGDLEWEHRYRRFEGPLDEAVKETMRVTALSASATATRQTDEANLKLVEMENRAFALVRAGRSVEAKAILFSDAYEGQKADYAAGMTSMVQEIKTRLSASQHQMWRRATFLGAIALLSVGLLVLTWLIVLRRLQQWRTSLARAAAALLSAHRNLEASVEERTMELKHAQQEAAREQARFKLIFDSVPVGIAISVPRFPQSASPAR